MTYYKYAERDANSQINWAEVSKGLSDTIIQVDKDRQTKKAAIDASTREAMTTLADAPKGENTTASAWTINYANDMMNYRLTLDRLLKSGQMKLSDYQVAAQNSVDSTNLVFTLSQEYQDQYKVIMDRSRTLGKNGMPQSSRLEPELAALNESFANISNTVPTINSTNGMVYLSNPETGEDGVEKLGKNYVSLQALRNRVNSKIDSYSVPLGISTAVSTLGKNTISELGKTNFRRTGVVTDISDPTLRKTYTEWEAATIDGIMANKNQLASVLADNMNINPRSGKPYTATYSKEEFDNDLVGDMILMENRNGSGVITPKFKEEQIEDAKAYLKSQVSSYIDKTEEKRPFTEPGIDYEPEYIVKNREAAKDADNAQELWQSYFTARTYTEKNAAKVALLGTDAAKEAGLDDIKWIDDNNIELIYANPENNLPISMADASGKRMSGLDWAKAGTEITKIKDVNKLRKYAKTVEGGLQLDKTKMSPGRKGRNENYYSFKASLADQPVLNLIVQDYATETAAALNAAYSQYGLSFEHNESGFTDEVIVKYKGKKVGDAIPVDIKEVGAASIKGAIEGILKNPPEDDAAAKDAAAKADAAKKGNSPIAAPGNGTFGSGSAKRKIKG